jgi:hypothetical protein
MQMLQKVSLKTQLKFPDAPDIYTGKQFTSEEFLSSRYHVRGHVLRRNWTKFVLDWRYLQGNYWTHLHSKECDCIIVTNKIKLMYSRPFKTTVVYKL